MLLIITCVWSHPMRMIALNLSFKLPFVSICLDAVRHQNPLINS